MVALSGTPSAADFKTLSAGGLKTQPMREKQTDLTPAFHANALVPWQPVAQWLSMSQNAIQKLIRQGLPVTRINQRVLRFRKSEIEAWLAEKKA